MPLEIDELFYTLGTRDGKLKRGLRGGKKEVNKFGSFVEQRMKLAFAAAGAAAVALGAQSIKAAVRAEKGLARVSTLVATTATDMDAPRRSTPDLLEDIPVENLDEPTN